MLTSYIWNLCSKPFIVQGFIYYSKMCIFMKKSNDINKILMVYTFQPSYKAPSLWFPNKTLWRLPSQNVSIPCSSQLNSQTKFSYVESLFSEVKLLQLQKRKGQSKYSWKDFICWICKLLIDSITNLETIIETPIETIMCMQGYMVK